MNRCWSGPQPPGHFHQTLWLLYIQIWTMLKSNRMMIFITSSTGVSPSFRATTKSLKPSRVKICMAGSMMVHMMSFPFRRISIIPSFSGMRSPKTMVQESFTSLQAVVKKIMLWPKNLDFRLSSPSMNLVPIWKVLETGPVRMSWRLVTQSLMTFLRRDYAINVNPLPTAIPVAGVMEPSWFSALSMNGLFRWMNSGVRLPK